MPRIARLVGIDLPHHITQRGNYRVNIFNGDSDRQTYLSLLFNEAARFKLGILAYCLMTNHVHFIAVPRREDSLANAFKYLNMKYSQYFNGKKGERGHLFHGRFFSSVMNENYMIACARYIERNPVRAGMVSKPWEWKWSSASVHCLLEKKDFLGVMKLFENTQNSHQKDWQQFISEEDNPHDIAFIKRETLKGRPIADQAFIVDLEGRFSRSLRPKPKGRPRKVSENKINSVSVPI